MGKMLVLINLWKKNEYEVIYNFGSNEECIDGIIRIDLKDINMSTIVKMPSDNSVYESYANRAFGKLLKMALNNNLPEKTQYVN